MHYLTSSSVFYLTYLVYLGDWPNANSNYFYIGLIIVSLLLRLEFKIAETQFCQGIQRSYWFSL